MRRKEQWRLALWASLVMHWLTATRLYKWWRNSLITRHLTWWKVDHTLSQKRYVVLSLAVFLMNLLLVNITKRTFEINWYKKIVDQVKYILTGPKPVFSKMGCLAFSRNSQSPYTTVLQSAPKPHPWNMSFATLDLNTVKKIRKATDTHFVCLMISAQFGAMRRLLLETKSEKELPEFLWVGSSLPWPQHPRKLTNHWYKKY